MATQVKTGLIANDAITDAKIANVALTGVTASSGDSSTSLATTAFVVTEINSLIDSAPGALNTLNELAAAMGDDANFSTTVTNSIATKLPLAGGTLTGTLTGTKAAFSTGSTTDYVLRLDDAGVASYDVTFPDTNTYQLTTNTTSDKTFKLLNSGSGTFKLNVEGDVTIPSAMLLVGDIKAIGVGGLALQTDEGTKRLFINDDGKIGIAAGGVIYAGRFSVGKPPSRIPGSVFTSSTSSFFSEATLGNSVGDAQKIVSFAGEDGSNVSGLALYRYRRVAGTNWTGDGFSLRQEVDNTANIYDYINFAGGKVGIGTDNPGYTFEVKKDVAGDWVSRIYNTNATTGYGTLIRTDATSANDAIALGVYADSGYKMVVRSTGRVGIGTASPSAPLHIQTNDSTTNAAVNSLMITNLSTGTTTTGFGGEIRFQAERNSGVNQNTGAIRSIAEVNSGTDISSALLFYTGTAGVIDEKQRITHDGNVIIGYNATNGAVSSKTTGTGTLSINQPGRDNVGGHIFMTQSAAQNTWMTICAVHDAGATGMTFLMNATRTGDQNRHCTRLVRYAYNQNFTEITVSQQNTAVEYRVSSSNLQYRFTTGGPYSVTLTIMADG